MYIRKLTEQVILDYGQAEVSTGQGMLRGVISEGTYIFRGVRYARARRFHMSEPPEAWDLDAVPGGKGREADSGEGTDLVRSCASLYIILYGNSQGISSKYL